ncbi:MAG TPA: ATP-binding protein [Candidatus Paceibacterota bacterium]
MITPNVLELLVTNVGFIASAILTFGLGSFVLYKNPRKDTHLLMFLTTMTAVVYMVCHILGINQEDPEISRWAFWIGNIAVLFMVCINTHLVLIITGKLSSQKKVMVFFYISAGLLATLFFLFSRSFMQPSRPLLYFTNYYNPGPLYEVDNIFYFAVIIYFLYHLYHGFLKANFQQKNRLWYFTLAFTWAYVVGSIPLIPLYYKDFDPIFSIFTGLWAIPLAYGILKEDLFDIRIIAKRALVYLMLIIASTFGLIAVNLANIFLLESYPDFPIWVIPLVSSFIGIGIGVLVWKRVRESDLLKYEFINVVTHKFRTPMTYIKFSIEELRGNPGKEMEKASVDRIEIANNKLIELTNVLVQASQSEGGEYIYARKEVNLNDLVEEILYTHRGDIASKLLTVNKETEPYLHSVLVDIVRIKSVLQIIIENAIMYSYRGGTISIVTSNQGNTLLCSVKDSGIGIARAQLPLIFSKFFRTQSATSIDTEGLGLGLYIAKNIIQRHGGKIWATSEGENKGSTFYVSLKAAK